MLDLINYDYKPHVVRVEVPGVCHVYLWKMRSLTIGEIQEINKINTAVTTQKVESFRNFAALVEEKRGVSKDEALEYVLKAQEDRTASIRLNTDFPEASEAFLEEQAYYDSNAYYNCRVACVLLNSRAVYDIELTGRSPKGSTSIKIRPLKFPLKKGDIFDFNGARVEIAVDASVGEKLIKVKKTPVNLAQKRTGFKMDWESEQIITGRTSPITIDELTCLKGGGFNLIEAIALFYDRERLGLSELDETTSDVDYEVEDEEGEDTEGKLEGKPQQVPLNTSGNSKSSSNKNLSTGQKSTGESNGSESPIPDSPPIQLSVGNPPESS